MYWFEILQMNGFAIIQSIGALATFGALVMIILQTKQTRKEMEFNIRPWIYRFESPRLEIDRQAGKVEIHLKLVNRGRLGGQIQGKIMIKLDTRNIHDLNKDGMVINFPRTFFPDEVVDVPHTQEDRQLIEGVYTSGLFVSYYFEYNIPGSSRVGKYIALFEFKPSIRGPCEGGISYDIRIHHEFVK
jgi:hypothetical protein